MSVRLTIDVDREERATRHLSAAEYGAWCRIRNHYWQRGGPLPLDHRLLARIAGLDRGNWRRLAPSVLAMFEVDEGRIWEPEVERDRAQQIARTLPGRKARKIKALARGLGSKNQVDQGVEHNPAVTCVTRSVSRTAEKPNDFNDRQVDTSRARAGVFEIKNQNLLLNVGVSDVGEREEASSADAGGDRVVDWPGKGSRSPPQLEPKPPAPSRRRPIGKDDLQRLGAIVDRTIGARRGRGGA